MSIYKALNFNDMRADLVQWLAARQRTYGEARALGVAHGPTWHAALLDGMLSIEGANSEDVVDGLTMPIPDARLIMGPKGYAELSAPRATQIEMRLAA
jgi:hypothetical protein